MGDLAVRAESAPVVEESGAGTIGVFSSDRDFTAAQRMAKALASSNLMPQSFQNNLPNVLIAMELAGRIGASVLMVAQNLDVIHGRPSWRASFLIACVNNSKRFTPLRFRFQGKEGTAEWGCRAVAKDRETGEECVGTLITMKMAADEGWSTKSGSKWKTLPELMLQYRAAAFWTRVFAPELSLGMSTAEEVRDVFGDATGDVASVSLPSHLAPAGAKSLEAAIGLVAAPEQQPASDAIDEPTAPATATETATTELAAAVRGKRDSRQTTLEAKSGE